MNVRTGDVTASGAMVVARPNVLGRALQGDVALHPLWGAVPIVTGSSLMLVDGKPVARIGDVTAAGDRIVTGDRRSRAD